MKRFINFIISNFDSTKEIVSILSFAAFMGIVIVALRRDFSPQNVELLRDALKYLCAIIIMGVFSIGAVDVFNSLKNRA
jgi:hypothetical protein